MTILESGGTGAIALELETPLGMSTMKRPGAACASGSQESEEDFHRGVLGASGARSRTL